MSDPATNREARLNARHSGLGIASFLMGAGMPLLIVCLFVFSISLDSFLSGYQRRDFNFILGLLVIFAPPFGHLIGLVFGIWGVRQPDRKKLFPVLGIIFNGLFLLSGLALVIIVIFLVFAAAGGFH
ncbi:MAG TPA: DUF6142 family protein [Pyrinomonadaceae bacterium]|nr:DUF6142 family protein [Pyrinomonadaceae bacterium]